MKSCGRRLKTTMEKCGTLFEGPGAYCRECRNGYQRDYYAKRKAPLYKAATEKTGASCQACSTALRSNTVAILDVEGLNATVTLCETCKAVVTYLSEAVDEAAQEFLVDLSMEVAALRISVTDGIIRTPTTIESYEPRILQPGNVEECGACEAPARPGKKFCKRHEAYEEDFHNSNAAKMERGEL